MEISKLSLLLAVLLASGNAQTPTPSPNFDCPDDNDSIHPDPEDCSKYYVCTNGLAWHESCAPGLLFDPITLECNWPDEVVCFGTTRPTTTTTRPTSPDPPSPTTPSSNTTTEEPVITTEGPGPSPTTSGPEPTTEGPVPTTTTTTPPPTTANPGFQCPSPDGTFPHPEDCNAYYVCENGEPALAHCPPGLHYDPILQVCNWPEDANCKPGHVFPAIGYFF